MDQYHLNLHVLDLNYNSTYTEMIKSYRSMDRRFHPDNNYGYHTTEIMTMISTSIKFDIAENSQGGILLTLIIALSNRS